MPLSSVCMCVHFACVLSHVPLTQTRKERGLRSPRLHLDLAPPPPQAAPRPGSPHRAGPSCPQVPERPRSSRARARLSVWMAASPLLTCPPRAGGDGQVCWLDPPVPRITHRPVPTSTDRQLSTHGQPRPRHRPALTDGRRKDATGQRHPSPAAAYAAADRLPPRASVSPPPVGGVARGMLHVSRVSRWPKFTRDQRAETQVPAMGP